jgi:hypothetical protein
VYRRVALLMVAAMVTVLVLPVPASSHFEFRMYSRTDSSCNQWSDPVTAVFYGNGDPARVINHIVHHTGWNFAGGSAQYFIDHGVCENLSDQRSSGAIFSTRNHVRIFYTADWDPGFGFTSSATPHFEDITCGGTNHAVRETVNGWSGFDEGRAQLYNWMSPGHYTWTENWGNTAWMQQCDGQFAYSNGTVRYFWIPWETH